jgi:hypothetical protein
VSNRDCISLRRFTANWLIAREEEKLQTQKDALETRKIRITELSQQIDEVTQERGAVVIRYAVRLILL